MSLEAFILARSCAEPDTAFPSVAQLARSIVAVARANGGDRPIRLREAWLARDALPGGRAISIALGDAFLGYAFVGLDCTVGDLREEIEDADPFCASPAGALHAH